MFEAVTVLQGDLSELIPLLADARVGLGSEVLAGEDLGGAIGGYTLASRRLKAFRRMRRRMSADRVV